MDTDRPPVFEQSVSGGVVSEILGRTALGFATGLHLEEARGAFQGQRSWEDFLETLKKDFTAFVRHLDPDVISPPWLLWETPTKMIDELTFQYLDERGECIRTFDPLSRTFGIVRKSGYPNGLKRHIQSLLEKERETALPPMANLIEWMVERFGKERCVAGSSYLALPMEEEWLILLLEDPALVGEYLDFMLERELEMAEFQAGLGIRVINGGGDLATKTGPIYSPGIFRRLILPRLKKLIRRYHELGCYYIYRTDGNTWSLAGDLFEASGTDGYGEIDIDAGMDMIALRERFPRLVLWGGLACGSLLVSGTKDQILKETRRLYDFFRESGGWIFGSSNTLVPGTNVEGYLAALEIVRQA